MLKGRITVHRYESKILSLSIGKLVRKNDGPEEAEQILAIMTKYGYQTGWDAAQNNQQTTTNQDQAIFCILQPIKS